MSSTMTNKGYGIYAGTVPSKSSGLRTLRSDNPTSPHAPTSPTPKQNGERQKWRGNSFPTRSQEIPAPDPKSHKIQTPENPSDAESSIYRLRGWIDAAESAGYKIDSYGTRQDVPASGPPVNPYLGPGYLEFDTGVRDFQGIHAAIQRSTKGNKKITGAKEAIFTFLEGQKRKLEDAQDRLDNASKGPVPAPGI